MAKKNKAPAIDQGETFGAAPDADETVEVQSTTQLVRQGEENVAPMPPEGASQHTKESLLAKAAELGEPLALEGDGTRASRREAAAGRKGIDRERVPAVKASQAHQKRMAEAGEPVAESKAKGLALSYDAVAGLSSKDKIEVVAAAAQRPDVTAEMSRDEMLSALFPDEHKPRKG